MAKELRSFGDYAPNEWPLRGSRSQESRKPEARICMRLRRMYSMQDMPESLSDRYADLLTGSYDCVDRIVLNAYFRMGHDPGGFRVWWRALTGSDDTLDNTHLMRLAGRFSRRIRGYAKAKRIPVVDCRAGERKHDLAEEYLAKTNITSSGRNRCPT